MMVYRRRLIVDRALVTLERFSDEKKEEEGLLGLAD